MRYEYYVGALHLYVQRYLLVIENSLSIIWYPNFQAVKNCNSDMIAHLPKIHIKPDHLNGFISVKNVREIEELIGSLQMISSHKTPQPKKRFLTSRQISYVSTDSFDENKRLGFQRIPSIQKNGSVYIFTSRNLPPALLQHSYQPHKLGKLIAS